MSSYGAIRQQEGFCPLLLISIYFKKRKSYSLVLLLPNLSKVCGGYEFQTHSMFICYEAPQKSPVEKNPPQLVLMMPK